MIEMITPLQAQEMVQGGQAILVDIREEEEYRQVHIAGSYLKPLSLLIDMPPAENPGATAIFFCHSGGRTGANRPLLEKQGYVKSYIIEGGIMGWQKAGLPVRETKQAAIPIMRQVQIAAGSLMLLFIILSLWLPAALWLAALVGMGLIVAGISGFCGLAKLLQLMPWNRA